MTLSIWRFISVIVIATLQIESASVAFDQPPEPPNCDPHLKELWMATIRNSPSIIDLASSLSVGVDLGRLIEEADPVSPPRNRFAGLVDDTDYIKCIQGGFVQYANDIHNPTISIVKANRHEKNKLLLHQEQMSVRSIILSKAYELKETYKYYRSCHEALKQARRDLAPSHQLLPSDAMDKTRITAERVRSQRSREQQELVDDICKTRLALVRVAGFRAVDKLDEDLALSCPE